MHRSCGLDVGTSRIVAARRSGEENVYESQLNAFVSIPLSKITLATLLRENVPHSIEAQQILVHGNESEKFAGLLNAEIRRPMTHGVLDPKEPNSLKVTREILSRMLGPAAQEASSTPAKVCFTSPRRFGSCRLTHLSRSHLPNPRELGFEPLPASTKASRYLRRTEDSNYTGIGISCGGGRSNGLASLIPLCPS